MAQVKVTVGKKINWTEMLIALVLGTFGIYFLVAGFSLQTTASGVITPIISYLIGLALLVWARIFKDKAMKAA